MAHMVASTASVPRTGPLAFQATRPRAAACAAAAPRRPLAEPAHRRGSAARAADTSEADTSTGQQVDELKAPPQVQEKFSVELPTADVQSAMRLTGVVQGRGAAIVVSAVAPGSAAAAAGVRVGQQLLAVSDPVRRTEMWDLNAQASLRYVRQAIRMRVSESIELKLSAAPIPEWQQVVTARRAAATAAAAPPAAQQQQPDDAAASGASMDSAGDDLLSAIVQEAEALRSGSSFDAADSAARSAATAPTSAAAGALTVADRLAAKYAAEQAGEAGEAPQRERALTDLERRQRRRKEYFEQASQRNDGPFFAAVAALFVIPPAAILIYAAASGYLDSLDAYSLLR